MSASYALNATSASYANNATTASYALVAAAGGFPFTGSAVISGSLSVTGSQSITGSLNVGGDISGTALGKYATTGSNTFKGVQIISSSVRGEQYAGSIASSTASFDCSTGNFFTLVLNTGTNHISASNIRPGQTINVRVTTQSGNAVTCSSAIKQPSGSLYTPTNAAGTDILTFISYDTTLFMVATKTFI
jgi:hypothetical protein